MAKASQQVAAFKRKFQAALRATAREAVQDTVELAQKTTGEGGHMRVDTGFLRASIQAALGGMPYGASTNAKGADGKPLEWPEGTFTAGSDISVALLLWDPNKRTPLYIGWTANYARPREFEDGFMRLAVQRWDQTVNAAAKRVRAGLG